MLQCRKFLRLGNFRVFTHSRSIAPTHDLRRSDRFLFGLWFNPSGQRPSDLIPGRTSDSPPDATNVDARPVHQERGEGIGLSIVKRLCELLDASMEMDSTPGEGTSLRIVFPRRYHSAERM